MNFMVDTNEDRNRGRPDKMHQDAHAIYHGYLPSQEVMHSGAYRPGLTFSPGDWTCPRCSFSNYMKNQECKKCKENENCSIYREDAERERLKDGGNTYMVYGEGVKYGTKGHHTFTGDKRNHSASMGQWSWGQQPSAGCPAQTGAATRAYTPPGSRSTPQVIRGSAGGAYQGPWRQDQIFIPPRPPTPPGWRSSRGK